MLAKLYYLFGQLENSVDAQEIDVQNRISQQTVSSIYPNADCTDRNTPFACD